MFPHGPGDSGELVGQCDRGFVVSDTLLQLQGLALDSVERLSGALTLSGAQEDGARAMDDEHAQVLVALLGDGAEAAGLPGAELSRCDTEPAREMAPGAEVMGRAGGGDERG